VANQHRGNELESTLASDVDEKLPRIVEAAAQVSGQVTDATLAGDLAWLMKTFVVRSPATLDRLADGTSTFVEQHRLTIESMLERAQTQTMGDELRSYLDARRPRTTAPAAVAAIVARDLPADLPWLEGDAYVASARECMPYLQEAGAGEFVTFNQPVVEWETGKSDLLASFAASPEVLVLLVKRGRPWTPDDSVAAAVRHTLLVIPHQDALLCRTVATRRLLATAAQLRSSAPPKAARPARG
jgi:hypothetical protein